MMSFLLRLFTRPPLTTYQRCLALHIGETTRSGRR
jgi:hypothetical protein